MFSFGLLLWRNSKLQMSESPKRPAICKHASCLVVLILIFAKQIRRADNLLLILRIYLLRLIY